VLLIAYKFQRPTIVESLRRLLGSQGVTVERESIVLTALRQYESGTADFSDHVILESARRGDALPVRTFDERFARSELVELVWARIPHRTASIRMCPHSLDCHRKREVSLRGLDHADENDPEYLRLEIAVVEAELAVIEQHDALNAQDPRLIALRKFAVAELQKAAEIFAECDKQPAYPAGPIANVRYHRDVRFRISGF